MCQKWAQEVDDDLIKRFRSKPTSRLQQPMNCLSVFDHFVGLALKGLRKNRNK